jgi:hypothetical protein
MELAAEVSRMPGLELRGPIDPAPALPNVSEFRLELLEAYRL